jgi:hypothetical protein
MRTRTLIGTGFALVALSAPAAALATPSPNGPGQPNLSCEDVAPATPPGFNTQGFANAQSVYAGSGRSFDVAHSGNAVSQYDVACFQLSVH